MIRLTGQSGDGYVQYLHVPNDERMETLCRRMIRRPEEIWALAASAPPPRWGVPEQHRAALIREQGVRCLRAFQSDENISLLRSVLKDPRAAREVDTPNTRLLFDEARAAADVLTAWGVSRQ